MCFSAVDAGLDLKGQMDNRGFALEEAYNNQIPLPLDGIVSPDRPLTQEEYETLVKADRANKAGSIGKGVGGVAGGLGAGTGAKIGGFFGSFLGPVGTVLRRCRCNRWWCDRLAVEEAVMQLQLKLLKLIQRYTRIRFTRPYEQN